MSRVDALSDFDAVLAAQALTDPWTHQPGAHPVYTPDYPARPPSGDPERGWQHLRERAVRPWCRLLACAGAAPGRLQC